MAVSCFGPDSEYGKLRSVLLHCPGPEISGCPDPPAVQHLGQIDYHLIALEFGKIIKTFEALGIGVTLIDPSPLTGDRAYQYNLMYCRDLLFMARAGAVIANMACPARKEEVRYAERALRSLGIPVLHVVSGEGRFEGADALWVDPGHIMIGVGGRTNKEGYQQVRDVMKRLGIACTAVPFDPKGTQHLLGIVQFVDQDTVLLRYELAGREVVRFLEDHHFKVVKVPESSEVRTKQAMNIVTVSPCNVVMPDDCPETAEIYRKAGLTIAAALDITQLRLGAGGLACATGIIGRD